MELNYVIVILCIKPRFLKTQFYSPACDVKEALVFRADGTDIVAGGGILFTLVSCPRSIEVTPAGRPARSPVYCLLPSTDRRAKNQLSNVRPPTSATAVFGSLKCTSATSPRFHVAGICWEDEQSRVFQDLPQPATPTTPRPLLSVHSGVKTELLDAVKARKLVYYGHTTRKQGSCLEKEIMQGTMPGARRRGRPRMAWMDNIKSWTGLPVEESVRMTEDRENGESTSMVWPTLGSRTAKDQNRTGTKATRRVPVEPSLVPNVNWGS